MAKAKKNSLSTSKANPTTLTALEKKTQAPSQGVADLFKRLDLMTFNKRHGSI